MENWRTVGDALSEAGGAKAGGTNEDHEPENRTAGNIRTDVATTSDGGAGRPCLG